MSISTETQAQILRYYHAERWRIGTIAVQLGLHRDTVARVLAQAGLPRHGPVQRVKTKPATQTVPARSFFATGLPLRSVNAKSARSPDSSRKVSHSSPTGGPGRP